MRAINAIIITSGLSSTVGTSALDQTIKSVLNIGKSPILVLGPDGDDWLSASQLVERCEIVFDPNFEGGFFSGVKAGLHATYGAAFILAVGSRVPERTTWDQLERAAFSSLYSKHPLVSLDLHDGCVNSPIHLITLHGIGVLKSLAANSDWKQVLATHCRSVDSVAPFAAEA